MAEDVKKMGVPPQTDTPGFALIVTLGTTTGLTVIVIVLLVAVAGVVHA